MYPKQRAAAWIGIGVAAILIVVSAIYLVNLPRYFDVCVGFDVSTELCESARQSNAMFGSALAGSSVIAAALLGCTLMLMPSSAERIVTASWGPAIEPDFDPAEFAYDDDYDLAVNKSGNPPQP